MPDNYSSWSIEKLNKEIQKIQKVIASKELRDKKATLAKLVSVARSSGFELHELLDMQNAGNDAKRGAAASAKTVKAVKSKKRGKVAPKYRNPLNPEETWTGRGRQPLWVKSIVESGGSLDDVFISA